MKGEGPSLMLPSQFFFSLSLKNVTKKWPNKKYWVMFFTIVVRDPDSRDSTSDMEFGSRRSASLIATKGFGFVGWFLLNNRVLNRRCTFLWKKWTIECNPPPLARRLQWRWFSLFNFYRTRPATVDHKRRALLRMWPYQLSMRSLSLMKLVSAIQYNL